MSDDIQSFNLAAGMKIESIRPQSFVFLASGKPALTIKADGTIEIGEGFTPDEAGKQAIEAMRRHLRFIFDAEIEACAKIAEDAEIHGTDTRGQEIVAASIASAIRARKDKTE